MIPESVLNMWRTVFAIAHADGVVTPEEKEFMADTLADLNLSSEQRAVLEADIDTPQDITSMYNRIANKEDKVKFFQFAKTMAWVDGDYAEEERQVIERLQKLREEPLVVNRNIEDLIGHTGLELEDTDDDLIADSVDEESHFAAMKSMFRSFKKIVVGE